jgi:hypothetical protein
MNAVHVLERIVYSVMLFFPFVVVGCACIEIGLSHFCFCCWPFGNPLYFQGDDPIVEDDDDEEDDDEEEDDKDDDDVEGMWI